MEMLKKSGIALVLGALMIASVPTTTQCWNLDLNRFSQNQVIMAVLLTLAPFFLLHKQDFLSKRITENSVFKAVIGTPFKDNKYEIIGIDDNNLSFTVRSHPAQQASGFFGHVDSLLKSYEDALKKWSLLVAAATFIGIVIPRAAAAKTAEAVVAKAAEAVVAVAAH